MLRNKNETNVVAENSPRCAPSFPGAGPAMAARGREKEPPDLVHQNQIFCETVRKELRCQKLHTEYGVNPLKRGEAGESGLPAETE